MKYYIIASNPRTGSHLLRSILTQNLCGEPVEMMLPSVFNPKDKTLKDFRKRCTKGNFCGGTLQVQHLKRIFNLVEHLTGHTPENIYRGLQTLFPDAEWIYLYRHDKVKQAISLVKARRTQDYRRFPGHKDKDKKVDYGKYNREEITQHMAWCCIWDSFWLNFFSRNGIEPLFISYEELVKNKLFTTVKIFEFLGYTPDSVKMNPDFMPIRQYDEVSQDWYNQYYTDTIRFV